MLSAKRSDMTEDMCNSTINSKTLLLEEFSSEFADSDTPNSGSISLYNDNEDASQENLAITSIKEKILRKKLSYIFSADAKKGENRVFLEYKQDIVEKIVRLATQFTKRNFLIGVSGESASGKTTIPEKMIKIMNFYEKRRVAMLMNADNFYYDITYLLPQYGSVENMRANYNFDEPEAMDLQLLGEKLKHFASGKSGYIPKYDFVNCSRKEEATYVEPAKIIISEGLFNLTDSRNIREVFDITVYVDVTEEEKHRRWWNRVKQRGLDINIPKQRAVAESIYANAMKQSKIHVRPTKNHADIVLNGNLKIRRNIYMVMKIFRAVKSSEREAIEIYYNKNSNIISKLHSSALKTKESVRNLFTFVYTRLISNSVR